MVLTTAMGWFVPVIAPRAAQQAVAAVPAGTSNPCATGSFGVTAGTLSDVCWFSTSGWNFTPGTTSGTRVVVVGNYALTFNVAVSGNNIGLKSANVPTWGGSAMGHGSFGGAGTSAFSNVGNTTGGIFSGTETVTLTNLVLTNITTGQTYPSGWGLVMADAESTNLEADGVAEKITFTSDKAVKNLMGNLSPNVMPASGTPRTTCTVAGFGTTAASCTGTGYYYTDAIVGYAEAPTRAGISLKISNYSQQGGAFGILLPRVNMTKQVSDRALATDQFTIEAKDSAGAILGAATTTGSATSISTGYQYVVAGNVSFSEKPAEGSTTNWSNYTNSWACVDETKMGYGTLPSFPNNSVTNSTTIALGQTLSCTVTNTPKPPTLTLVKNLTRIADRDQATVAIMNGGTQVAAATTTGTAATATTAATTLTKGTTYTLTDTFPVGSNDNYQESIACVNKLSGSTTVLPSGSGSSFSITPGAADQITCTFTNVPDPRPAIAIEKTAPVTSLNGPGTVTYTYKVTNTGNETLVDGAVADDKCTVPQTNAAGGLDGDADGDGKLDVGETFTFTCTSDLTADTTNTASVYAKGEFSGTTVRNTDTWTVKVLTPQINITKTGGTISGPAADGSYTVTYVVKATNNGSGSGSYGPITDTPAFASNLQPISASWSGAVSGSATGAGPYTLGTAPRPLAAGASETYNLSLKFRYTNASQAAGCAGAGTGLFNSVSIPNEGGVTTDNDACVTPPAPPAKGLTLVKKASAIADTNGNGMDDAGDTITYSFTVTNDGQTNLTPITITDAKLGLTNWTCSTATLAPKASVNCTATRPYTITAQDQTTAKVVNVATATGKDPLGSPVDSKPATTTTTLVAEPNIQLTKTVAVLTDNAPVGSSAGDVLRFGFTVKNTGNTQLTDGSLIDSSLNNLPVSCPKPTLDPGESMTCTNVDYVVTQADMDAGSRKNVAVVKASDPISGQSVTTDSTVIHPLTAAPALSINKHLAANQPVDVNGNGITDLGDTISYEFTVKNEGNVTLNSVRVADAKLASAGVTTTCQATTLDPGQQTTCTSSAYTITAADVTAKQVANTATAKGTPTGGAEVTSPTDDENVPVTSPSPKLTLTKQVTDGAAAARGDGRVSAGETLTYTFTVKNDGNVAIDAIAINDSFTTGGTGTLSPIRCDQTRLLPGASTTCTASYEATQADVDATRVDNRATVTGNDPAQQPVTSNEATATIPAVDPVTQLTLTKNYADLTDTNGNGITDQGDTANYVFDVTNEGNVTMTAITVVDPKLAAAGVAISCAPTSLAPGQSAACKTTSVYTLSAQDAAAGAAVNTAHAEGTSPATTVVKSPDASATIAVETVRTDLVLTKAVTDAKGNGDGVVQAGEELSYTFTVTNQSNVTVTNVAIADTFTKGGGGTQGTISCDRTTLVPGAVATCIMAYSAVQSDVDAGAVSNTAKASGQYNGTTVPSNEAPATIAAPAPDPSLSLVKRPTKGSWVDKNGNGVMDAGDTGTFTFIVKNTGNVTLDEGTIEDPKLQAAGVTITCPVYELAPGLTTTCTSAPYTITTEDTDLGMVRNVATATGKDPNGTTVISPEAPAEQPVQAPQPALTLKKSVADANNDKIAQLNEVLRYSFTLTNTGNVALTDITGTDTFTKGAMAGKPLAGINCPSTTLAVGDVMTCTAAYVVAQGDLDAGAIDNTAVAQGSYAGTVVPTNESTAHIVTPTPVVALIMDKSTVDGSFTDVNNDGLRDAGDTVRFQFVVTNTGTVTMTDVTVNDPKLAAQNVAISCDPTTLAPRASVTCTSAPYTVTEADQTSGAVHNVATATGTPPSGTTFTTPESTWDVPLRAPEPRISLVKSVTDASGNSIGEAGELATYHFTVTNDGNVPLTQISIEETAWTGSGPMSAISCPDTSATPLAVGASVECTATYTVTQADIDNPAQLTNTAVAHAEDPNKPGVDVPSKPSSATLPTLGQEPSLAMAKSVADGWPQDSNGNGITDAGDQVVYTFKLTNTGNVTLHNLRVDDALLRGANVAVTCAATDLAVGASTTCTSTAHTLTEANQSAGELVNTATAHGTITTDPASTDVTSPPDDARVVLTVPDPGIRLLKDSQLNDGNGNGFADQGETIDYTFTVINTGNTILKPVTFDDSLLGLTGAACVDQLGIGETATCPVKTYTVKATDVGKGLPIHNVATPRAEDPGNPGTPVPGNGDEEDVPTSPVPRIALVKHATVTDGNGNGVVGDAGDKISYDFSVTNTGEVDLVDVAITDAKLGLTGANVLVVGDLAKGITATVRGPLYTITQADQDADGVWNTATVTGDDQNPATTNPTASSSTYVDALTPYSSIELDKRVENLSEPGADRAKLGDLLEYTFVVYNTNVAVLYDLTISDPMFDVTDQPCAEGPLKPGGEVTCSTVVTHRVTQADIDNGMISNTATAKASDRNPLTTDPTAEDTEDALMEQTSGLSLTKALRSVTDVNSNGITDAGDTVLYGFLVTNTGTMTINEITINDPTLADAGVAITCDRTSLAATEQARCASASYTLTEADQVAGKVTNVATAEGVTSWYDQITSNQDDETVTLTAAAPKLQVVKSVKDADADGLAEAGETLSYTFTVTNTGNVPMQSITITEEQFSGTGTLSAIVCQQNQLNPQESTTCSATYQVTQSDVDSGEITNQATAHGVDPNTPGTDVPSEPDEEKILTPPPAPRLTLQKDVTADSYVDVNGNALKDAGDTVRYTFSVKNEGNVTLSALTINDPKLAGATPAVTITCDDTALAPQASTKCRSTDYTFTRADEDAALAHNEATVTGTLPKGGTTTSEPDTADVVLTKPVRELYLDKTAADASGDNIATVGEEVTFVFTVQNTGNVAISSLRIDELAFSGTPDKLGTPICDKTELAVNETTTCRATYPVTQADVNRGEITNTAKAVGIDPTDPTGGEVPSNDDGAKISTPVAAPALSLAKRLTEGSPSDTNGNGIIDAGDQAKYTFTLTNNGNVTLTGLVVNDEMLALAGATISCPVTTLDPFQSTTCESTEYQITAADEKAGTVTNTATATGKRPDGGTVPTDPATQDFPVATPKTELALDKTSNLVDTNGNGFADAGETIRYSFKVRNAGNVILSPVTVTDARLGLDKALCLDSLAALTEAECLSTDYVVTAEDVALGEPIVNSATAEGADPGDPEVPVPSNPDEETNQTSPVPGLALVKQSSVLDANGNGLLGDQGDHIRYSFVVTNTGAADLVNVLVSDQRLGLVDGKALLVGDLAMGESATVTAADPYVITASDVTAQAVDNVATATGDDNNPATDNPSATDEQHNSTVKANPAMSLQKSVTNPNQHDPALLGDELVYSFSITNTGNVPLYDLLVNDEKIGIVDGLCDEGPLAPGETVQCTELTRQYTVQQADVDGVTIVNTATATGDDRNSDTPDPSATDGRTTPTDQTSGLTLDKGIASVEDSNNNRITDVGDRVNYTFTVRNTGSVTLHEVRIDDALLAKHGAPAVCQPNTLAANQSVTCTASYAIVAEDVVTADDGTTHVPNTATAHARTPGDAGTELTSLPDSAKVDLTTPTRGLDIYKWVNDSDDWDAAYEAGETLSYNFTVSNTGNVPISDITVEDRFTVGGTGELSPIVCDATTIPAKESVLCHATYVATQADVDAGKIHNQAIAHGIDPNDPDTDVSSGIADAEIYPIVLDPKLQLLKTHRPVVDANGNGLLGDAGDSVVFDFTVTNIGSVTLSDVRVDDPLLAEHDLAVTCPAGATRLAPKGEVTCHSEPYTITKLDETNGAVHNVATAKGTQPGTPENPAPSETPSTPVSDDVPTVRPAPALTLDKRSALEDTNGNKLADVGERISYTFVVTNTGNVDLAPVTISDDLFADGTLELSKAACVDRLPIGATATCSSTLAHTVTTADLADAAKPIVNVATATGIDPGDPKNPTPAEDDDTEKTTVTPKPAIDLTKIAEPPVDANGNGLLGDAGDTIAYRFLIRNTGNLALTGIVVNDPVLGVVDLPIGDLAIGAETTIEAPAHYAITQADVAAGGVRNTASVTGDDGNPDTTNPSDSSSTTTSTVVGKPRLELVKDVAAINDVNGNKVTDAGDTIVYSFVVTNTGTAALDDVTVEDEMLTEAGVATSCPSTSLAPKASVTCTSEPYQVTAADELAKVVHNVARATATTAGDPGTEVASDPSVKDVPVTTPVPTPTPTPTPTIRPSQPTNPPTDPMPNTGSSVSAVQLALAALSAATGAALIGVGRRRKDDE